MHGPDPATWTHIRVRKTTVERLLKEAALQEQLYQDGCRVLVETPDGRASMDAIIRGMLAVLDRHRERAKRSRRNRRLPKGPDAQS